MARCTAPVRGHRTASGRAACPVCGRDYGGYGSYSYPSYSPSVSSVSGGNSVDRSGSTGKPRWSRAGSSVVYTPAEVRTLTPVRENVEKRASMPDLRDVFLCHAWDDRKGAAKELHDLLESLDVSSTPATSGVAGTRRIASCCRLCRPASFGPCRMRRRQHSRAAP
jgi:hypothetical protein